MKSLLNNKFIACYKNNQEQILLLLLALVLFSSWMGNAIWIEQDSKYYNQVYDLTFVIIRYLSYALMALATGLNWLLRQYKNKPFLIYAFITASVFVISRSTEYLILMLGVGAFAPLKERRILPVYIMIQGFTLFFIPFLSALNILPNVVMDTERMRYALGFTWVTTAPVLLVFFTIGLIAYRRKELNVWMLGFLAAIAVYLYILTDTRMAFVMELAVLILAFLWIRAPGAFSFLKSKKALRVISLLPVVLTLAALLLAVFYNENNAVLEKLNAWLSGRLANGHAALNEYGLSILGKKIVWIGNGVNSHTSMDYLFVDCSYLNILLNYGIVFLCLVMYWLQDLLYKIWRKHDVLVLALMVLLLFFCFLEVRLVNPLYNPFAWMAGRLMMKNKTGWNWRKTYGQ